MIQKTKIENIKKLIGKNKFDKAFAEMEQMSIRDLDNIIILYRRKVKENKEQFNLSIKNLEDFNVTNARISLAILESLDELIDEDETNMAQQFLQFGQQRLSEEDFSSAKIYFDKAIIEDNSLIEAYLDRGAAKLSLEDYHEAIVDFSIAIKLNPKNPIAFYNRGIALFQLGELEKACKNWKEVKALGFDIADEVLKFCL